MFFSYPRHHYSVLRRPYKYQLHKQNPLPASPSMTSSTASPPETSRSREKLFRRVILPAIRGQSCPICLGSLEPRSAAVLEACKHAYCLRCIRRWSTLGRKCPLCNSVFDSWFADVSISSRSFHHEILPPLSSTASATRATRGFRLQVANQRSENFD